MKMNIGAFTMFPMFTYLSYSTLDMRGELMKYKESEVLDRAGRGWLFQKTVYDASRFVAVVSFFFGE